MKDPAARAAFRALWKRHTAHKAKDSATDPQYWTEHEAIKTAMKAEVNYSMLTELPARDLLRLATMQGRYQPCAPHSFITQLSIASDMIEKATTQEQQPTPARA